MKLRRLFFLILTAATSPAFVFADNPWAPPANLKDADLLKDCVVAYETTANKAKLFRQETIDYLASDAKPDAEFVLTLDPTEKFQTIDGFGAAITGSASINLTRMPAGARRALLVETFSPTEGLGYGYVRVSIGCSDFSLSEFSLWDEPGEENFALSSEDLEYVIPILKEIKEINPNLKIMASPWTCPPRMKVNNLTELKPFNSWTSGQLNPKYYDEYARYFVKYLTAMKENGVEVASITMQNEPLNRGNSASLFMTWQEQKEFVKVLAPKMREAGFDTEILAFDHNFNYDSNKPECKDQFGYPLHIYEDEEAAQYIAGAAYHAYGGNKEEMKRVRDARPDKALYFTEQSIGSWGYSFGGDLMWFMREIAVGTLNYDCKAVIVWNFMLDDQKGPNRPGGCQQCYGAVNLSTSDHKSVERYSHFYEIGHLAKGFGQGAVRVGLHCAVDGREAEPPRGFYATSCLNPDGTAAVLAVNDSDAPRTFEVRLGDSRFLATIDAKATRTFKFQTKR